MAYCMICDEECTIHSRLDVFKGRKAHMFSSDPMPTVDPAQYEGCGEVSTEHDKMSIKWWMIEWGGWDTTRFIKDTAYGSGYDQKCRVYAGGDLVPCP